MCMDAAVSASLYDRHIYVLYVGCHSSTTLQYRQCAVFFMYPHSISDAIFFFF